MHLFFLREAWRSIRQHRGLASTAIFSLTAALSLSGAFLLLAHNADLAMRLVGDRREMVVYLRDDVNREQRTAVMERLRQLYGQVTYVSKEEAWEEFEKQVGDPELLGAVEGNPLPASIRVRFRPELLHHAAMEEAAKQVEAFPEVEDVRYGGEWVRRIDAIGLGLQQGAWIVGVLVALAILLVMYNTIRLTVLARRPHVEIMSRLGATDRFIATPFVIEAVLEAGFAALLALGVMLALQRTFVAQVVSLQFVPLVWAGAFLVATIVLAWLAALIALSRVMRAVGP